MVQCDKRTGGSLNRNFEIYIIFAEESKGMKLLELINLVIFIVFTLLYFYQHIYLFIGTFCKPKQFPEGKKNRFAVLISARNEENVIGHLIESVNAQDYPRELVDIYVVADNCQDGTASVARRLGAHVYERFDQVKKGKGHALTFLFEKIFTKHGKEYYDGFFVFDADNLLEPNYITEMNKTFSAGYRIVTSYRNSKNYSTNWLTSGYALWFIREAVHLNNARTILGTGCMVSGTGFLFHKDVAKRNNGWKFYLLTEDIEFTVDSVLHGDRIGYCHSAMFYDEQPFTFGQAWNQRLRWSKGYLQVFRHYGWKLFRGIFCGCPGEHKNRFACFDMSMTIMPALILSIVGLFLNLTVLIISLCTDGTLVQTVLQSFGALVLFSYAILFVVGVCAGIKERRKIKCTPWKKVVFYFTFPFFIFTYIPITIVAFFKKVEWKPIVHTVSVSYDELQERERPKLTEKESCRESK